MDARDIKNGALIELRDDETDQWIQLTVVSVVFDNVECRTLANEPILTTIAALKTNARLRPRDGSCADCGHEAHDGPCTERRCSECNREIMGRCFDHPLRAVHVYRRIRYLAEVIEDKPYPTQETAEALRRDLIAQMHTLRASRGPQGWLKLRSTDLMDVVSAIENAVALIESLPKPPR